jgi:hypothetical protein
VNTVREFKFGCPICHQHIKCDASSSGQIIACPTCYRQIVVPQAPSGNTTKLILRAKQAAAPSAAARVAPVQRRATAHASLAMVAAISMLVVAGAVLIANHLK